LPVGGAGDLDPAVLEAGAGAGHAPGRVVAERGGLGQEVEHRAAGERLAPHGPGGQQLGAPGGEAVVQEGEEAQRLGGEDLLEAVLARAELLDPARGRAGRGGGRGSGAGGGSLVLGECHGAAPSGMWRWGRRRGAGRYVGGGGAARGGAVQNCAVSVEPTSARVLELGFRAVATRSKYPVPTSA